MIDCENEVYTRVANVLREQFEGINLSSEYTRTPASFPHVCIEMSDSYPYSMDGAKGYDQVMFTVNVYSNRTTGRKSEARLIMAAIDSMMHRMNFTRTSCSPTPNMADATIYRMTAQYRAGTDGKYFYRR